MAKYGYARVSTLGQSKQGNSLEHQIAACMKEGVEEHNIFIDRFTGTKSKRPKFSKLLDTLQDGDTLVVSKLDRFARSSMDGQIIVEQLINRGIRIHILNIGIMDTTPASKLIRNVFFAFAEFERDLIVERTAEGKAIAKLKPSYKEGRPRKYTAKQLDHAIDLLQTNTMREVADITGISASTIKRELKMRREK
jgi:DNA invertase Pin-like site-specific DNA recombinase